MSGKLYNWLLCASKRFQQREKRNVKRGERIGGSKKRTGVEQMVLLCRGGELVGGRSTDMEDSGRDTAWNKVRELQV